VSIIHRSPLPQVAVPDLGIGDYVLGDLGARARRVAMIEGSSGRSLSYAELADAVRRVAGGLAALGIGPGSTVALMAPNLPEYAIVFHAVAATGACLTTLNPLSTESEVRHQLADSGACLLVTVPAVLAVTRAASAGTAVSATVLIGAADQEAVPAGTQSLAFGDLLRAAPLPPRRIDPDAIAVLPYSSGTTGLPKGVMLSHRNLVANIAQMERHLGLGDDEVMIAVLPFFHIYGMQVIMNDGLRRGATLITMPRFDLAQFLGLVQQHRVTRLLLVPPIILALAKHPLVDDFDLSSVRSILSGAAPLGAELSRATSRRLGIPVVQGYGMTEMSPVSHACRFDAPRDGSIGILVANAEARIVDPASGEDLGLNADGELWIRGPMVMQGYHANPEASAATLDADGWLHTGDIGHVDAGGYWYLVDRLKELIKVSAFQVAPARLEALLLDHPAVADAAVIGIADEACGEIPKAFVVLRPGMQVDAVTLQDHVAAQVASYERIRLLEFVDAIPKSPSGKILRRLLRGR
jgi:acyl-CoA synthetase (AMP-forming)/AMP-acid ligase II